MLATMPRRRKAQLNQRADLHPLTQWRARYEVTQDQMAEACHISQGQLSKIERFQQLPLRDMLERLRTYTGLPTDAFIRPLQFVQEEPDFMTRTRGPR